MKTTAFDDLMAGYPPEVQALAARTRDFILQALPKAEETIDTSARMVAYGYGPGYKGMVCTLIPSRKGVKLGLYRGSELPDPKGLLEGSGKVHRHVQLATPADLRKAGLKRLLRDARAARDRRPV
jgi:hypothetical protein